MINLGNTAIGTIKLGTTTVTAIYLGTTKIFPSSLPNINITSYLSSGRIYVSANHAVTSSLTIQVRTLDDFDHVTGTSNLTINSGSFSSYITMPSCSVTCHILSITPTSDSSNTYTNADLS